MTTISSSMVRRSNGAQLELSTLLGRARDGVALPSQFLRKRIDNSTFFPTLAPVKMKITSKLELTSAPVAVRLNSNPHAGMWVDRPHGGWGESS